MGNNSSSGGKNRRQKLKENETAPLAAKPASAGKGGDSTLRPSSSFESRVERGILHRVETTSPSSLTHRRSLALAENGLDAPGTASGLPMMMNNEAVVNKRLSVEPRRLSLMHPGGRAGSGAISLISSSDRSLRASGTVSSAGGGSGHFAASDRSLKSFMRVKRSGASDQLVESETEEETSGKNAYYWGDLLPNEKEKHRARFLKSKAEQLFLEAMERSPLMSKTSLRVRRALFEECVVPIFVRKAEVLFEAGTTGQVLFVLVAGVLERIHPDGGKYPKRERFLKAPAMVAEQCLLVNEEHGYTCVAKEPGLVLCVHRLQYQMISARIARACQDHHEHREDALYSSLRLSNHSVASIPLLAGLSEEQVKRLDEALIEKTFKHYSTVIHAADVCPGLYIIKSGRVSLRAHGGGGAEPPSSGAGKKKPAARPAKPVEWLGPGDYFGELSLLNGSGQLGLDVVCAMDVTDSWGANSTKFPTVTLSLLRREDFVRILGPEMLAGIEATHLMRCISNLPYFSYVSTREISTLAERLVLQKRLIKYDKGARIVVGGSEITEEDRGMFVIVDGPVRMMESQSMIANDAAGMSLHRLFSRGRPNDGASASDLLLAERGVERPLNGGGSFLALPPALVGGGSTARQLESEHNALFPTSRDELTILFSGVFGEDVVGFAPDAPRIETWPAYAVALGSVTVAHINEAMLRAVGIYELVQRAYLDELQGVESDDPFSGETAPEAAPPTPTTEASGVPELRRLSSEFLNAGNRIPESERAQALSRMMTSKFDLTSGNFYRLAGLHQTPLVDVYVAMHSLSNQLVILKAVDVRTANQKGMAQYLLSEQLVLSQLSTPFVANLFASWEEPGKLVMSLEPCLGGDYEALLFHTMMHKSAAPGLVGELGGLSLEFLRFTSACVILALKHCFEHRIIHRDLKPGNITLDHRGYAKLVDFGIAKIFTTTVCRTKSFVGSPKYMSPEMNALGFGHTTASYTNSVDWWAFGVTLYQLALGYTPFEGDVPNWHKPTQPSSTHADKMNLIFERIELYSRQVVTTTEAQPRDEGAHPVFDPFAASPKWSSFRDFLTRLMEPNPHRRLGSSRGGPREAMDASLFDASFTWDALYRRQVAPPHRPQNLIVDIQKIRDKAKEINERGPEAVLSEQRTELQKPRPKLVHASKSLESKVRDAVESSTSSAATQVRSNVEHSQLIEDVGREMQLRSLVLKQSFRGGGVALDSEGLLPKQHMQMSVLMRAGVLRSLQTQYAQPDAAAALAASPAYSYLELVSALRIQRQWRGVRARRTFRVERYVKYMEAVLLIQRFLRVWLTRKREEELVAMALM